MKRSVIGIVLLVLLASLVIAPPPAPPPTPSLGDSSDSVEEVISSDNSIDDNIMILQSKITDLEQSVNIFYLGFFILIVFNLLLFIFIIHLSFKKKHHNKVIEEITHYLNYVHKKIHKK